MSNNTNNNENHHLIHSSIGNTRPESETENGSITGSCEHLSELRSKFGSNPFRNFPNCVKVKPFGRASILRDPELIHCGACEKSPPHAPLRLFACVTCAKVFCNVHARSHAPDSDPSLHNIAVDVSRAELYCGACGDQVYDRDFDAAIVLAQTEARGEEAGSRGSHAPANTPKRRRVECKRRRVEYKPWTPDVNEQVLIVGNSSPFPSQIVTNDETTTITQELVQWGLRGLNNLGNTCFMNSVLQALLHTPPLRNYFLSDKHNRYYCQRKNSSVVTRSSSGGGVDGANKNNNSMLCLACDLDAMFSAVFSGNRTPISPAKFLYSWWKHASNLASYEQQDAHEFFISVLDGIHERLQNDKGKAQSPGCG